MYYSNKHMEWVLNGYVCSLEFGEKTEDCDIKEGDIKEVVCSAGIWDQ